MKYTHYTLADLAKIKYGKNQKKVLSELGNIPIYGTGGIMGYATDALYDKPSVLIGRKGTINKVKYIEQPFWTVDTLFYTEVNENLVIPKFLYYVMSLLNLDNYNEGTTIPSLRTETLYRLEFDIPSLQDQERILSILKSLDDKIEVNSQINKNLEEQAHSYFNYLFLENAKPNWEHCYLSDIGKIIAGGTPSKANQEYYTDNGIAWITPKDLSVCKSKFIAHGENDITELGYTKSSATKMPAGTVLFSSRAPIGYIAVAANEVTTNQGFKSVIPNDDIGTAFIYYFLKHMTQTIENMASGSTFKEISSAGMKIVPAFKPDFCTLKNFNDFCNPLFEKQKLLELENEKLSLTRDSLLPKLMSGEIDVSEIEI